MPTYLVTISIGPVQSLIGAARRTRDLWCGSWLLSEASRAAARTLHAHQPCCLIFPCLRCPDEELKPLDAPGDTANIANILRAEVEAPHATVVRALCERARAAAVERLGEVAEAARGQVAWALRADVWQAQVDDVLETFAAWMETSQDDYRRASEKLGTALAARKATRDFAPSAYAGREGLPKSSLDGAMETVLKRDLPSGARHALMLSDGEQLDTLGVIKRLGGKAEQFTAYSRVAADPWLRERSPDELLRLCDAYEPLVALSKATRTSGNNGAYKAFPYDGQLLHPFRLANALAQDRDPAVEALGRCVQRIGSAPLPYAAILKADGDRMGALLSEAETADHSRMVSRELHAFASSVGDTVRSCHGHAVYAGGDDVLALVPLPDALKCADALRTDFHGRMTKLVSRLELRADMAPTLSAGIGIGHLMEPLGALRARAEAAEVSAKGDAGECSARNALAIKLGVRAGGEITWRARWDDADAFDALSAFMAAYRDGSLPSRVAYDLRAIDRRFAWLRDDEGGTAQAMRAAEVRRMLDRARANGQRIAPALAERVLEQACKRPLADVADALILARWMAARQAGDLGEQE